MASSLVGSFLVARPTLLDPNFRHTVVLLLAHNDEGAYGVVINRPQEVEGLPFPVYAAGPCPSPGLVLLHGHAEWLEPAAEEAAEAEREEELVPGIFIGDAACLARVTETESDAELRFRVFKGYAGWGPGQLEQEMAAGSWAVLAATPELLFDTPADELWNQVAPPAIPQPSMN